MFFTYSVLEYSHQFSNNKCYLVLNNQLCDIDRYVELTRNEYLKYIQIKRACIFIFYSSAHILYQVYMHI